MVAQRRLLILLIVLPFAVVFACDKVPLLAPTGTVITLLPVTTTVSLNSEVDIIATVIENGTTSTTGGGTTATPTSRAGAGTPVQNGTVITFTTTLGRIEPSDARTHNGQVTVKLITGGASGTANVTAFSGGASASVPLKVGAAGVGRITVTTNPQTLGPAGGTATVFATVTDVDGGAVGGVPVAFSTDKGSVTPSTSATDGSGVATATLTTTGTAKVTATAGTQTNNATVTVAARSLQAFSAAPTTATTGAPVTFTITPALGSNLTNVRVNFGDGRSVDTGPLNPGSGQTATGATVVHVYTSSGIFTATATPTDANGDTGSLSTTVVIGSLGVTLTLSPTSPTVNTPTTITAAFSAGATPTIDHFVFTFDSTDGGPATIETTAPQVTRIFSARGAHVVRVDVFGVGSSSPIGTATTTFLVQ